MFQLKQLSRYLYNPYPLSYITFLDKQTPPNTAFQSEKEGNVLYNHLDLISDVGIEPQMNDPITSFIIVTTFSLILLPSVVLIQTRTLKMLKRENGINTRMMEAQAKLHMIYWPSAIFLHALVDNIYPLSALTSPHFCAIMNMYLRFGVLSMTLYSFYAALLRYLYLVHEEIVAKFGKTKIISVLFWVYYLHTFLWSLWTLYIIVTGHFALTGRFFSRCYGSMDRVFLLEVSYPDVRSRQLGAVVTGSGKI